MRRIIKTNADYYLSQKNKHKPKTGAEARIAWHRFGHKSATAKICLKEQYGLCCYSEICLLDQFDIIDFNGVGINIDYGYHIEHIEPKSKVPFKTFEHNNLVLSAINSGYLGLLDKNDIFGGHFKINRYSVNAFISPLFINSRDYFHYEASGRVVPKESLPSRREKAKARFTIYLLNLNAPVLVNWRKVWLGVLTKLISDEGDIDALKEIADLELSPINGSLRPFHSAQRQFFGKIGDDICKKNNL
ncbi:TPA: retron system putative HNH endonuclease [Enterobacter cloacae]|uniref:retron system putative HNH endonuclease n=1 Tax=Enterobacter cloacae TaxID=550 RepID=UPI0020051680|nr:retron system putative HNH endonuclease [Enterobacter cloacae]MCK7265652.1 TIGR02646 family protein [Enterobacter cloacae]HBL4972091.1 TIGR02646 family protein [Enterobacter cloacae]HDC4291006.1 TIGR02646 family protein [Enterobacter cloacae]